MSDELSEEQKTIQELRERILELEQQIDWFNRQLFGRKSERHRNGEHPDLFNPEDQGKLETSSADEAPEEGEEEGKTKKPKRPRRRQSRAQKLPDHLPERITYHDPQEVQADPDKWRVLKEERRSRLTLHDKNAYFNALIISEEMR